MYSGIDISKNWLDLDLDGPVKRLANHAAGHAEACRLLPLGTHVVLEATGPYSLPLTHALQQAGFAVTVANPLAVKRFAQSRMLRAKTDRSDARLLSDFGRTMQPPPTLATTESDEHLRQRERAVELLKRQRTALRNQLEALHYSPWPAPDVVKALNDAAQRLDQQLEALEQAQQQTVEHQWPGLLKRIESVPGIGRRTAMLLLATTRGFTRLRTAPQLLAYIGLCLRIEQSGQARGRARLSKQGQRQLRTVLYMCAKSAARFNPACKALSDRLLQRGKAYKVRMCAVAAKLVRQVCGMMRSETTFSVQLPAS